eukprot:5437250-Lingulodinium_polyedra.AAC.1
MFCDVEETNRARVDGGNVYVNNQPLVRVGSLPNVRITLGYRPPRSAEFVVKMLTELVDPGSD